MSVLRRARSLGRILSRGTGLATLLCAVVGWSGGVLAQTSAGPATPTTPGNTLSFPLEVQRLANMAPAVTTLEARYRIESVSTVEGAEKTFFDQGRIFYNAGDFAAYRELTSEVDDMQLLYRNGELLRYFPLSGYGHRIVDGSHDKDRTEFSRYWRPLLAHLTPAHLVAKTAGVGSVEQDPESNRSLVFEPDRAADLGNRPSGKVLEYWGPQPDVQWHIGTDHRVQQLDRTLFRVDPLNSLNSIVEARSQARLEAPIVFDGILLPTRIVYEITLEGQTEPYRTSTVELLDVQINASLPPDAFAPIWPADAFLLDVEPGAPEDYLPLSDQPAAQIRLADAYFGRGQTASGIAWAETFHQGFDDRLATPSEVGQWARLLTLADRKDEARKAHLDAIRQARQLVDEGGDQQLLVRYFAEYAYFMAYHLGREMHGEAGRFLEGKLGELNDPVAIAMLAGFAANQYTHDSQFGLARDVLTATRAKIGAHAEAAALLDGWWRRVEWREEQESTKQLVWAKRGKIRQLEERLASLRDAKLVTPGDTSEIERLQRELEELRANP